MNISTQRRDTITQGSLWHGVWALAWSNVLNQLLFMFPGLYDAIWLGQLGREAQAAAGLATSARMTMISVLMALSLGSGAVVARYVGARDRENANLAAMQAVILMLVSSGVLGLIGILFAEPLMKLAGADAITLPFAIRYARILFAGLIAMEMVPSMGFMLNAAGDFKVMLGMSLLSAAALLIEPLLVRWWGLEGAVLALIGSNAVATLLGLGVLLSGRAHVHVDLRKIRLDLPMMGRIWRVSLPAVIQRGAPNLALSVLTRLVSAYGAPTLAAWVVTQRVVNMVHVPGMGLSRAAPAIVGQNLGAAQPERAERAVGLIARVTAAINVVVFGLLALFAAQALALFSQDSETVAIGAHATRMLIVGCWALNLNYVFDAALSGAGDTISPMVLNMISIWGIQIPAAYLLSRVAGLQADGVWLALEAGWIVQAVLIWVRFRQGKWKLTRI